MFLFKLHDRIEDCCKINLSSFHKAPWFDPTSEEHQNYLGYLGNPYYSLPIFLTPIIIQHMGGLRKDLSTSPASCSSWPPLFPAILGFRRKELDPAQNELCVGYFWTWHLYPILFVPPTLPSCIGSLRLSRKLRCLYWAWAPNWFRDCLFFLWGTTGFPFSPFPLAPCRCRLFPLPHPRTC